MGESALLAWLFEIVLNWAIDKTIEVKVKRVVDGVNRIFTAIGVDDNGNGVLDDEEIAYKIKQFIPDLSNGMTVCNSGDEVGIGSPVLRLVDSTELPAYLDGDTFTGADDYILVDYDSDGNDDNVLVPLPYDLTGDGSNDWGLVIDDNDDGLPDSAPNAPFFPIGSPEFTDYMESQTGQGSIIIVSGDGTMTVYDMNGDITSENCDTAYSLWVSENNILDKPLDNYSVSEGLLFLILLIMSCYFVLHLFKRKDVYR